MEKITPKERLMIASQLAVAQGLPAVAAVQLTDELMAACGYQGPEAVDYDVSQTLAAVGAVAAEQGLGYYSMTVSVYAGTPTYSAYIENAKHYNAGTPEGLIAKLKEHYAGKEAEPVPAADDLPF